MHERLKWLDHNGKKILYNDYRNLAGDEMLKPIQEMSRIVASLGEKDLLLLLDFRDSFANKANLEALKKAGEKNKHLYKKTAVLGITGIKKVFLEMINRLTNIGAKPFKNEEEAKDWLVS
ncbi:MAG: STAS/SEC14 domain-containing protein [Promethearchaeota archaeon]